jgi:hypothetical protein
MDLKVELAGNEIVVTRPGTDMMVAYRKTSDKPTLLITRTWLPRTETTPEASRFRAFAFQAAIDKARELGWIV